MRIGHRTARVTVIAGSAALVAGLVLAVAPPRGTAPAGALPVPTVEVPARAVEVPAPAADAPGRAAQPPVRLVIPAIGVDARVVDAAVTPAGSLAVPEDRHRIGWWIGGALPGAPTGTLVLAGHVDDRAGRGALFRLRELPVGAVVYVDGENQRYAYRVAARRMYPKQRLPAEVFDRGAAHRLVLITCGGAFHWGRYDDNIVLYAGPSPS
jgi:hypothetical protein